jgi:hypothetical protein
LKKESELYLERGAYDPGTYIIDGGGLKRSIVGVRKIRKSRFILDVLDRHPWWLIEVQISEPEALPLDQAKEEIIDLVRTNRWHRQGDQSAEQFRKYIEASTTFKELIDKISFYGSWQPDARALTSKSS